MTERARDVTARRHQGQPLETRRRSAAQRWGCRGLLALLGVVGVACGAAVADRGRRLGEAVQDYNESLRWGRHERAAAYLPDAERPAFLGGKRAAADGLQVHDLELRGVQTAADGRSAVVRVLLTFSRLGDPRLESHLVDQRWRWQDLAGWQLIGRSRVVEQPAASRGDPATLY